MIFNGASAIKKFAGRNPVGFFPGELGVEPLAFAAAAITVSAVIDADATGGRAVPEITQDLFVLQGKELSPSIAVDTSGATHLFEHLDGYTLEAEIRALVSRTRGSVLVFDHLITGKEKTLLCFGVLKKAIEVAMTGIGLHTIDQGIFRDISYNQKDGFLAGTLEIASETSRYRLFFQNEHLVLLRNGKPIVTCPSLIMLFNIEDKPIHNAEIQRCLGQRVTIRSMPPETIWRSPKGHELFGPRHFGLDFDVCYFDETV